MNREIKKFPGKKNYEVGEIVEFIVSKDWDYNSIDRTPDKNDEVKWVKGEIINIKYYSISPSEPLEEIYMLQTSYIGNEVVCRSYNEIRRVIEKLEFIPEEKDETKKPSK